MLFNSFSFLFLVILTFLLYYLPLVRRYQVFILIISSFVFYSWHFPALTFLLAASILINAVLSQSVILEKPNKRKILILGVAINLAILVFFKYSPLIGITFISNDSWSDFLIAIPLPIGISFFTFQGISLLVDAYRNRAGTSDQIRVLPFWKLLFHTSLYISLFPQLVAGPIVKAHDFYPQIRIKYLSGIRWNYVFQHVVTGYFLKMVVADNLKDFTGELVWPAFERFSSIELLVYLFGYSMQIFADFAGYSLIAIGISGLFGYIIPQNFNFPYVASGFSDFWKRWHISLSTFLKEYLYIPLGGNRKGRVRTYLNLMVVMALGGLWHGAAWSYMVWGTFHGLALATERFLNNRGLSSLNPVYTIIKSMWVFFCVSFAWLLFKLPEFNHVIAWFKALSSNGSLYTDEIPLLYIFTLSLPVILYHGWYLVSEKNRGNVFREKFKPALLGAMITLIILNSGSPIDFIYFQF
ncbi:MAG: MBOAT family O-acyltransferase [Cyclobacteriaceae bacterium]